MTHTHHHHDASPVAPPLTGSPVAVEGVQVTNLPGTGSGSSGTDYMFGLLLALALAALILGIYGAGSWFRERNL